ncbi:unnamed protein product [marine sediment metagenome]|uniref:Uncharacterized protein n=1 Tax=marine sediment metagenome TaxID=412755 RepID=X0S0T6_9ZZZZ
MLKELVTQNLKHVTSVPIKTIMWFIKSLGEFGDGSQIPVIADLSGTSLHAMSFFSYFSDAPTFNTYDLILDEEPQVTLEDILNAISEKEETKEDFTTA